MQPHRKPLTRDDLTQAYATYGRPRSRWLVGGEFERHLLDAEGRPAPYEGRHGVRELLHRYIVDGWIPTREGSGIIALVKNGASITLEPGAQFELSGKPYKDAQGVLAEARAFATDLDTRLASGPFKQSALGFTPFAEIDRVGWVPKGRYAIMGPYLRSVGRLGHHMMKGTCATQASFDFSDERDAAAKMRVSIVLAPIVTAMFANSPLTLGKPNGYMSFRGHIWTDTDPARCGFPDAAADFSYARWIDWMLDVPMMFTKSGGVWRHANGRTFRDWMEHGDEGRFPTEKDWDLHLTSVFPEVRIKQQIEVRMGDCVPLDLAGAFVALWEGLFYDRRALDQAQALAGLFASFGSKAERFDVACKQGLGGSTGGRRLSTWAESVVAIAKDGLTRVAPQDVALLAPLERVVASGESPAAHLLRKLGGDFSPANVLRHTAIDSTVL